MGINEDYLVHAQVDDEYFTADFNEGKRFPGMASLGHLICERYLKHIIDKYAQPENLGENGKKESVLHTHSLRRLLRYIGDDMGINVSKELKTTVYVINDFHVSTAYPGDESFIATPEDVESAAEAVEAIRDFVCEYIRDNEKSIYEHTSEQYNDKSRKTDAKHDWCEVERIAKEEVGKRPEKERLFGPGGRVERARAKADELNRTTREQKDTGRDDLTL